MAVVSYYSLGGQIVGQKVAGGERLDYLTDALGSVTATVNPSAQVVNSYRYKPYGARLARSGTAADPSFLWVGTQGYRAAGRAFSDVYVRARHYSTALGRWTTKDPIGYRDGWNDYLYARDSPSTFYDYSGLQCRGPRLRPLTVLRLIEIFKQKTRMPIRNGEILKQVGLAFEVSVIEALPGYLPNYIPYKSPDRARRTKNLYRYAVPDTVGYIWLLRSFPRIVRPFPDTHFIEIKASQGVITLQRQNWQILGHIDALEQQGIKTSAFSYGVKPMLTLISTSDTWFHADIAVYAMGKKVRVQTIEVCEICPEEGGKNIQLSKAVPFYTGVSVIPDFNGSKGTFPLF